MKLRSFLGGLLCAGGAVVLLIDSPPPNRAALPGETGVGLGARTRVITAAPPANRIRSADVASEPEPKASPPVDCDEVYLEAAERLVTFLRISGEFFDDLTRIVTDLGFVPSAEKRDQIRKALCRGRVATGVRNGLCVKRPAAISAETCRPRAAVLRVYDQAVAAVAVIEQPLDDACELARLLVRDLCGAEPTSRNACAASNRKRNPFPSRSSRG
jgi:hypothetical protein